MDREVRLKSRGTLLEQIFVPSLLGGDTLARELLSRSRASLRHIIACHWLALRAVEVPGDRF
jgi:hypothetical protein